MEHYVESMNSMRLVGKVEKQMVDNVQANLFWDRCREDGILAQLSRLSTSPSKEWIGIADGQTYDGKSYLYYIATPCSCVEVPAGYTDIELPASLWVKFLCSNFGAESTADEDIWPEIYSNFLPNSGYIPSGYQLEVYPCGDGSYPDEISEVWVSVRKRL